MDTISFLIIAILFGFALLMIYLFLGGYNELLSAENAVEGHETLPSTESNEGLYDGRFDFGGCECDPYNIEYWCSGSGRTYADVTSLAQAQEETK